MRPYRTVLFVPAHKASWYAKAAESGSDAICFDLEDSVPAQLKEQARANVAAAVRELSAAYPRLGLFVRPNALGTKLTGYDLEATVVPGLTGVFAPKIDEASDVIRYDALVDYFEARNGCSAVEYIVPVETVRGIQNCAAVAAASPRMGAMIGPTAEHADIAKAVGYEWTPEGTESLYHRTRVLLACLAAGLHPLTALWERIGDLDGLRDFAVRGRKMGFRGQVVLHPSHVAVVNEVFTPPGEDVTFYTSLLQAYEDGAERGDGAVMFGEIHIDKAHADKARDWLERAGAVAALHGSGAPGAHAT
jgi:citrate lyase subunit beta / citryl-CoA lyase